MVSSSPFQFTTFVGEGVSDEMTFVDCAETTPGDLLRECPSVQTVAITAPRVNGGNGEHSAEAVSQKLTAYMMRCEREAIFAALDRNNWCRTKTAKELGISRVTLYNKMKKFGISDNTEATQEMVGLTEVLPAGQ